MTRQFHLLSLILVLGLSFCSPRTKEKVIHPTWIKHNLPNSWIIYLPQPFKTSPLQGIDSQPGYIASKVDSILLNYDSGSELIKQNIDDCKLSKQVSRAKSEIENDLEDYVGKENKIYNLTIEILDERVAIIRTPIIKGQHRVQLTIKDCKSGTWLNIYGENFSEEREKLIVEIFKTVEFNDK